MWTRALVLFVLAGPAAAVADPVLLVLVRSEERPWTDFRSVRVTVQRRDTGATVLQVDHPVRRDDHFNQGVRVLERTLPEASYLVTAALRDAAGATTSDGRARIDLAGRVQQVSMILGRAAPPPPSACQSAWSRAKRSCGQVLSACIAGLRGDRSRLPACQEAHAVCVRSADRRKAQCEAAPR